MQVLKRSNRPDRKQRSLRVALLTYRGNPACGGQGVYVKYLSRALRDLGHRVTVFSGPPYPELPEGVDLQRFSNLDLYNPAHLFTVERKWDLLSPINQWEYISMCLGGFPEPLTFGWRTYRFFSRHRPVFDIVHDNQCLSYGILGLPRLGYPTVATIHHPITVDREMEFREARTWRKKIKVWRWYAFIPMQRRVSRRLERIITVSESSRRDISREFDLSPDAFRVVPNGINTDFFYPLPRIPREPNRLIVTSSAETPLKGLGFLLDAVALLRGRGRPVQVTVVGNPKEDGTIRHRVKALGLADSITFTGRIPGEAFAEYYARATVAVIPSLYEGFGMPAGEAMACGVPVVSTVGGALPEVVGDAGVLVPPADPGALAGAIGALLDDPDRCRRLGAAGLDRVKHAFTWRHAAEKTVETYREAIHAHH